MRDISQSLPPELLIEILSHVPVPNVLRLKQVNHAFYNATIASPLVQHKIDLFKVGLEYNAAAGVNLDESRKALLQYNTCLKSLSPIEKRVVDFLPPSKRYSFKTAGGVHAVVKDSVRLFRPGSALRRIPYKEWEIPLPAAHPRGYCFYPGADIIAFVDSLRTDWQIKIHLRALSDGGHHPAAQRPLIFYSRAGGKPLSFSSVSVTTSRLSMLASDKQTVFLVVWDWRTTQVLFEVEEDRYDTAVFIDDYQLLVGLGSMCTTAPCLVLIDTEKGVGGTPRHTRFHLSPRFAGLGRLSLVLEQGAHKPSAAESLAPFHQDPSQRIVALDLQCAPYPLVLQVGALLELKSRGEADIEWDEWKSLVAFPHFQSDHENTSETWVSGCRLFSLCSVNYLVGLHLDMHDFNMRGDSGCLYEEDEELYGDLKTLGHSEGREEVPRDEPIGSRCGNGSIIFFTSSGDEWGDSEDSCALHIWTLW